MKGLLSLLLACCIVTAFSPVFAAPTTHVVVNEVFYDTPGTDAEEEWWELYNPTATTVDLSWYKCGDAQTKGSTGEGMYQFPAGASIAPGAYVVVALKDTPTDSTGFYWMYGFHADFEINPTNPNVPDMIKYTTWATGTIALGNTGDQMGLLDSSDVLVDVALWEGATWPPDTTTPHPGVATGHSIERDPPGVDTDHCENDFVDRPNNGTPGGAPTHNLPPIIKNTTSSPCIPNAGDVVTVSSTITDDFTITGASLCYRVEPETLFTCVAYTTAPGDSVYSGTIPGQAEDALVSYYVSATDDSNATSYDPSGAPAYTYKYRVGYQSIYDVQTVPAGGDISPYVGQLVNLRGIVTDGVNVFDDTFFYLEDPAGGKFSGIKIYDSNPADIAGILQGDDVSVAGWVNEYYGMTEISHRCHVVNSAGHALPAPVQISTGALGDSTNHLGEGYESVLCQARFTIVTNDSLGFGEWQVDDDDHIQDSCRVDDDADSLLLTYTPTVGDKRDITGIVAFAYGDYKIEPCGDADIVQANVTVTLTPDQLPIVIPSTGGSFGFTGYLTNNTSTSLRVTIWTDVVLPSGSHYGPVFGPMTVRVPAHQTVSQHMTVVVPRQAPAGSYSYNGYVGTYPSTINDQSTFPFSKSGVAAGGNQGGIKTDGTAWK